MRRQMLRHRHADAVEVERASKRLAERDQPLELVGAMLRVLGRELGRLGFRLLLMASAGT